MSKILFVPLILLSIVLFACHKNKNEHKDINWPEVNKKLINVNKYLVAEDSERIAAYILRQGWDMVVTKSGFWYLFTERGTGDSVKKDDIVSLAYKVELLDGTECYNSDSLGLLKFKVGMGGVISGLERAVLMMRQGDKAIFIFPPILAYGLVGDGDRVPPRTILVYHIEVVGLKKAEH